MNAAGDDFATGGIVPKVKPLRIREGECVFPLRRCPRCGGVMFPVATPREPGDESWVWGHDCEPD